MIDNLISEFNNFGLSPYIKAILILGVGYLIANFAKRYICKILAKSTFHDQLAKFSDKKRLKAEDLERGMGSVIFWVIMIFFIYVVLDVLNVNMANSPLYTFTNKVIGFVPNILASILLFVLAYAFAFKICGPILGGILRGATMPSWVKLGKENMESISHALVTTLSSFVFLLLLPASLDVLNFQNISEPIKDLVSQIMAAFPLILVALVILTIGLMIAKIVKDVLVSVLNAANFDDIPGKLGLSTKSKITKKSPTEIIGYVAYISIAVISVTQAAQALKLGFVSEITSEFTSAFFGIIGGLVILILGIILAKMASTALEDHPKIATVARYAIMILAITIALDKANFAPEITSTGFQMVMGGFAIAFGVGGAIALGLGGKDFVAQKLKGLNKK